MDLVRVGRTDWLTAETAMLFPEPCHVSALQSHQCCLHPVFNFNTMQLRVPVVCKILVEHTLHRCTLCS